IIEFSFLPRHLSLGTNFTKFHIAHERFGLRCPECLQPAKEHAVANQGMLCMNCCVLGQVVNKWCYLALIVDLEWLAALWQIDTLHRKQLCQVKVLLELALIRPETNRHVQLAKARVSGNDDKGHVRLV